MLGLASIVILGLLLVLLFLALARHRMLALVALGFIVLFVGLPLIALKSYRATGHQRARQVAKIRWQDDRFREAYDREQWRQFQRARPNRRAKPAEPGGSHAITRVHEQRVEEAKMLAELTPGERLTHDWPQTLASEGSGGVQAELVKSTDMESLQTAEEPAGSGELLAVLELPEGGDVAKAAATPPSAEDEAPGADLTDQAPAAQRPDWVLKPPQDVDGEPAEVLVSDPFETGQECDQDIQRRMIAAIHRFADRQCQQIGAPQGLNLPVQAEDLHLISRGQRFVDVIPTSVGPMTQAHQLVVYNEDFRRILDRRISEAIVGQRLVRTGVFSGGVLLLVGSLFGILKGAARREAKAATK
jgi:hypothetical protein